MGEDENHLVTGPPGSGKTNLLVLRAMQLVRGGTPNVRLLVFNRTPEDFIANNPTPYALPRDNITTLIRWEMELINQLGGTPSTASNFDAARAANCDILTALCDTQKLKNIHDVILLDECQDYLEAEIQLLFRLGKSIFAAGDDRQSIYNNATPIPLIERTCKRHHLSFHYRNGRKICELADAIGKSWEDYVPLCNHSQYNERNNPSKVAMVHCDSIDDQGMQIVASLRTQLTAFPDEMLGVICPLRKDLEIVRSAFLGSDLESLLVYQSSDDGYVPFTPSARICLCTLHGAKGLEFRAAHLAGVDGLAKFRERQRWMAYTAVTRAKTSLTIYDAGKPPAYIQGSVAAISPKAKLNLEDLFKA